MDTETRRVFVFFGATYAVSWSLFAAGFFTDTLALILLGVWGPTLMGTVLTLYDHRLDGLRTMLARFGRVRVGVHWWLALLLLPVAVPFAGRSLWQTLGPGPFEPQFWVSIPVIITSLLIAGLGEELGWRGFALPRLQRTFSPLTASLVLAGAHFFWHLPMYGLGQGIHNVPMIYALAFFVPWTIVYTWIYNRTRGSLIFAVGFHAVSNAAMSVVRFMPLDAQVPISPALLTQLWLPIEYSGPYLTVVAVYWGLALTVVLSGGLRPPNTDLP